jgi:hypothetical protein
MNYDITDAGIRRSRRGHWIALVQLDSDAGFAWYAITCRYRTRQAAVEAVERVERVRGVSPMARSIMRRIPELYLTSPKLYCSV